MTGLRSKSSPRQESLPSGCQAFHDSDCQDTRSRLHIVVEPCPITKSQCNGAPFANKFARNKRQGAEGPVTIARERK